jgi:hypothetical protein
LARRSHRTRNQRRSVEETEKMLEVYADVVENFMAIPVIKGLKHLPKDLLAQTKLIVLKR